MSCKRKRTNNGSPVIWHNRPTVGISCLYPELLSMIFEHLDVEDKGRVAQVCTSWREAAYRKSVWRGVEAKLHLKRYNSSLFPSLVRRGIKRIQVLSLQRSLREVTQGVPNLECLTLTGCYNLTDEKLMSAFSQDNETLVELNLSMCKQITDRSVYKIAQHLKALQVLDLGGCSNITNSVLLTIHCQLRQLKQLNLRSCRNITDSGIARLCGQSSSVASESTAETTSERCEENTVLEYLGLQDCQKLTDEALKYISAGLKNLKSINLSFCSGITEFGLKHLSAVTSLTELNLRSCANITDTGIKYLSDATLRLRVLDISFCDKIGDQGLNFISQGLNYLHSLSLNSCSISDEGLIKVSQTLNDLSMLNVGQCNRVTDKGLNAVAENCRNLRTIDLYGCTRITTIGLERVMQLPHLNVLNLGLWQDSSHHSVQQRQQQQQQKQQQQQQHPFHRAAQQLQAIPQQSGGFIGNLDNQFMYRDCVLTKLCDSCQNVNFLLNNQITGSQYYLLLRVCKT